MPYCFAALFNVGTCKRSPGLSRRLSLVPSLTRPVPPAALVPAPALWTAWASIPGTCPRPWQWRSPPVAAQGAWSAQTRPPHTPSSVVSRAEDHRDPARRTPGDQPCQGSWRGCMKGGTLPMPTEIKDFPLAWSQSTFRLPGGHGGTRHSIA